MVLGLGCMTFLQYSTIMTFLYCSSKFPGFRGTQGMQEVSLNPKSLRNEVFTCGLGVGLVRV